MEKRNTADMLQVTAQAMDMMGEKVPQILELLGWKVSNQEFFDKVIEEYGEDFYEWMIDYFEKALPSYEGFIPKEFVASDEIKEFIFDLLLNFYIARMLLFELHSQKD